MIGLSLPSHFDISSNFSCSFRPYDRERNPHQTIQEVAQSSRAALEPVARSALATQALVELGLSEAEARQIIAGAIQGQVSSPTSLPQPPSLPPSAKPHHVAKPTSTLPPTTPEFAKAGGNDFRFVLTPVMHTRPFSSTNSKGKTVFYHSTTPYDLAAPPMVEAVFGYIYMHTNSTDGGVKAWIYTLKQVWEVMDREAKVFHPQIGERVLIWRNNGEPSWVTSSSYMTMRPKHRKSSDDVDEE